MKDKSKSWAERFEAMYPTTVSKLDTNQKMDIKFFFEQEIQSARAEGAREALEKAKKKVVKWHVISKLKHLDAIAFFLQNPNEVEIKYALPTENQIDHLIKEYKKPLSPKEEVDE